MFTDYYGEQSCTAGRSSFITGQVGLRMGNTKGGMPGAPLGLQKRDVTIAELLRAQGYATGQFGKNHLGDRDEFLPTNHGLHGAARQSSRPLLRGRVDPRMVFQRRVVRRQFGCGAPVGFCGAPVRLRHCRNPTITRPSPSA